MADIIYLDHAATTPADPRVVEAMLPYFTEQFGNPSSKLYRLGAESRDAVEAARESVAALLNAKSDEIYFTSGGTESDNWAIIGSAFANEKKGNHIITSAIEHHAVLESCHFLEKRGFEVTYLPVDEYGMIDLDDVKRAITDKTILVTIMHANNEVGTLEPIAEIGEITRERGIHFHTDTVQTVGRIPVDVAELKCDSLAISAHKFYGPKGVGAMFLRKGARALPYMQGGGQEKGKRAGTHNVPGIVGLGKAAELALEELAATSARLLPLRDKLTDGILERIPDVKLNGHPTLRLPNNLNVSISGIEGESIIMLMDMNNVCASTGSACSSDSLDPSHVLLAMGLSHELAHGSVRFTLGKCNTEDHIDHVLHTFPCVVERLRAMSPLYAMQQGKVSV
ncbi:MAG: cysteine desulfurase NifS [Armatimonadota bacterium]|nr:cysteine desulfurase NifS [Armatimonadota bacterium]